jgi:ubiquitin-conjugating enzyme E2 D/E
MSKHIDQDNTSSHSLLDESSSTEASRKRARCEIQKQLTVRLMSGEIFEVDIFTMERVLELREAIAKSAGVSPARVKLLAGVEALEDTELLADLDASEVLATVSGFDPKDPETSANFLRNRLLETQGTVPAGIAEHIQCEPAHPITIKRISSELKTAHQRPGIAVEVVGDNIFHWKAIILGPADSPYENALFECHVLLPTNYPQKLPKVFFATPIYHCNVDTDGWMQWDPKATAEGWTVVSLLLLAISWMADPLLDCPANADAAMLYSSDRAAYEDRARQCASMHAALSL